jgi:hypothetical protein
MLCHSELVSESQCIKWLDAETSLSADRQVQHDNWIQYFSKI